MSSKWSCEHTETWDWKLLKMRNSAEQLNKLCRIAMIATAADYKQSLEEEILGLCARTFTHGMNSDIQE